MGKKKIKKSKICITALGSSIDSMLDPRFGRAMFLLIVDKSGNLIKAIDNSQAQSARGAGVATSQLAIDEGVDTIITGNVGPNAFVVLNKSGVKIFISNSDASAKTAFEEYKKGNLREVKTLTEPRRGWGRGFGNRYNRGWNKNGNY